MFLKFGLLSAFALAFVCIGLSNGYGEEPFPPNLRLRTDSIYWTSVQKECDIVWRKVRKIIDDAKLSIELAGKLKSIRGEGDAERAMAHRPFSIACAGYYAAARGKEIYKRYEKYGSKMMYRDVAIMQAGLDLYIDAGTLLYKGNLENLDEMIAGRLSLILNLTNIRSKLEPDIKARYIELVSKIAEGFWTLSKYGHDLSLARKAYGDISGYCIGLVEEFYLCAPSSVDLFIFVDSKGRKWVQFKPKAKNPYFGKDEKASIETVKREVDKEKVKELLAVVRKCETVYKAVTVDSLKKLYDAAPEELKKKLEPVIAELK